MKIAHIAPRAFVDHTTDISPYKMALGQYLLIDDWYFQRFRSYASQGCHIIIDNGAAEKDTPAFDKIVHVANRIGADEIVLPDRLEDAAYTFLETAANAYRVAPRRRVIIPQGRDTAEWLGCLRRLDKKLEGRYRTIGIAKHFEGKDGRPELIKYLLQEGYHLEHDIHLFGFYGDPIDEIKKALEVFPFIRGADSGAATAWAQRGKFFVDHKEHLSLDWDLWNFEAPDLEETDEQRIAHANAKYLMTEAFRWSST